VRIIAATTIWTLFSCFLLFPQLGLPPRMHRAAMTLLVAELVALGMNSYFTGPPADVGRSAATLDVPVFAVALVALAVLRGVRPRRRRRGRLPGASSGP
jgi:hypothetical protein